MILAIIPFISIKNECQRMGVFDAVVQWNPLIPAFSPKLLLGAKGCGNDGEVNGELGNRWITGWGEWGETGGADDAVSGLNLSHDFFEGFVKGFHFGVGGEGWRTGCGRGG